MNESEKFWDKHALRYSKSRISDDGTYRRKLAETQNIFKPQMHVLEFGCGTGMTAVHHAPHVSHIDAIDVSEKMLEIGRDRAAQANVKNITFTRSTLIDFDAESASMDAVLGLSILHLVPDRLATLEKVGRIVKPGGYFVSSTACMGNSLLRFIKLIVPIGKLFGLMPDFYVFKEADLASEIMAAGFEIERQWKHGPGGITVFIIARKSG